VQFIRLIWYGIIFTIISFNYHATGEETKSRNQPWDFNIAFGFSMTSGNNDTYTLSVEGDARKQWRRFRYKGDFSIRYRTTQYVSGGPRIVSTNNWIFSSRLDWFLSRKRDNFLFVVVIPEGNEFRGFWWKVATQGGFGYRFFGEQKNIDLTVAAGFDYSYEEPVVNDVPPDQILTSVIKPELEWEILPTVRLSKRLSFWNDLRDGSEYKIDSRVLFDFSLTDTFSIRTSYLLNHRHKPRMIRERDKYGNTTEKRIPAERTDHSITTAIVLSF